MHGRVSDRLSYYYKHDATIVPRVSSEMGERAFSVAVPQLRNCIPLEIKKSKFTHLGKNWKLCISAKIFSPKSSVSCWIYELERQTDNENEPDWDLQRL